MTRHRPSAVLFAAVAIVAAACSDAPGSRLSPSVPQLAAAKSGKKSETAQRGRRLARELSASLTVDRRGGTLAIEDAGFRLTVPPNALPPGTSTLTITATALAGDKFAYEFGPSGVTFTRPLQFEQDIADAAGPRRPLDRPVVSYFRARADIDPRGLDAVTFEDLLTNVDVSGNKVKADVWHFSGYIVVWGRGSRGE